MLSREKQLLALFSAVRYKFAGGADIVFYVGDRREAGTGHA
jgi:hypothetical protein